jgi:hypothetical protein
MGARAFVFGRRFVPRSSLETLADWPQGRAVGLEKAAFGLGHLVCGSSGNLLGFGLQFAFRRFALEVKLREGRGGLWYGLGAWGSGALIRWTSSNSKSRVGVEGYLVLHRESSGPTQYCLYTKTMPMLCRAASESG